MNIHQPSRPNGMLIENGYLPAGKGRFHLTVKKIKIKR